MPAINHGCCVCCAPARVQLAYEKLKETLSSISEEVVETVEVEALGSRGAAGAEVSSEVGGP